MTRLAVLADIHGNLPALNAVIDDMAQFDVDHVVVAGDSVNCAPFSREVLEIVTARQWAVVRGNNAYYALDHGTDRAPANWSDFTLPPLLREQLGEKWLRVIACQPDTLSLRFLDAPPLRVFHGIPGNPWQAIFPSSSQTEVSRWLANVEENTVICAHSHIPLERHVGRWRIINPGSVGVPLDGEFSASYMVIEGNRQGWELVAHRRVPFSYDAIFEAFEAQRFVERGGVTARLVIEEFHTARLQVHPYMAWKNANYSGHQDSALLLDEFLNLDDLSEYTPLDYRGLTATLYQD